MLQSNGARDIESRKMRDDSIGIDYLGVEDSGESGASGNLDRLKHKRNAEARRRIEELREDKQLQAIIDGSRWF